MAYSGKYKPGKKYKSDPSQVFYRSLWEYNMMKWLDQNDGVVGWISEVPIRYKCLTDNNFHTYYIDFEIHFKNGQKLFVEIKPEHQTKPPQKGKRVTKRYLNEVMTYGKNVSKWAYAKKYAESKGYKFRIFTENELRKLGIRIIS